MKAITIHQPWASLVIQGHKRFETRTWKHNHIGNLAIHAGLKKPSDTLQGADAKIIQAIGDALFNIKDGNTSVIIALLNQLPRGAILGTTFHVGCRPIDAIQEMDGAPWEIGCWDDDFFIDPTEHELLFGDWTSGRYAWEQRDPMPFGKAIPAKGRQGLWEWRMNNEIYR